MLKYKFNYKIVYTPATRYKNSFYTVYKRRFSILLTPLIFLALAFLVIGSCGTILLVYRKDLGEIDEIFWNLFAVTESMDDSLLIVEEDKLKTEGEYSHYV